MATALPKRDVSLTWARCTECGGRHTAGAPCPKPGQWMVVAICMRCKPRRYCPRHDTLWIFKGRIIDGRLIT